MGKDNFNLESLVGISKEMVVFVCMELVKYFKGRMWDRWICKDFGIEEIVNIG